MFEGGKTKPHTITLKALNSAFAEVGIQFTDDDGIGVKLKE